MEHPGVPLAKIEMALVYELLGLIGSFLISSSVFAQIYKVMRTRSASDISSTWQLLYITGVSGILVYGYGENLWPIYVPVTLELSGALVLLLIKVVYDKRAKGIVQGAQAAEIVISTPV